MVSGLNLITSSHCVVSLSKTLFHCVVELDKLRKTHPNIIEKLVIAT